MKNAQKHLNTVVLLLVAGLGGGLHSSRATAADIDRLCNGEVDLSIVLWASYAVDEPLLQKMAENRFAIVGTEADGY